jgi:hypothetical protein
MLHRRQNGIHNFELKKGQRGLLCSNKVPFRCPSLGLNSLSISEDDALNYLAEILVDIFLDKKRHANNKHTKPEPKESSNLLPSIDEGTGR